MQIHIPDSEVASYLHTLYIAKANLPEDLYQEHAKRINALVNQLAPKNIMPVGERRREVGNFETKTEVVN